jgi:hypothetical protein
MTKLHLKYNLPEKDNACAVNSNMLEIKEVYKSTCKDSDIKEIVT